MTLDLTLRLRGAFFIFNLSPDSTNYPVDAAAWVALVAAVAATANEGIPSVFGWSEPEPDMTGSTSKGGGTVVCDGAPNLSFWTHVNNGTTPKLPYNRLVTELNRQAHYIAWQTNEGDTPKILAALMQGVWLSPARGSVPMGWGIDPLIIETSPGLLGFYANTATANDTFFAATAGAGYAYPWMMPNKVAYESRAGRLIGEITPGWPPNSMEVDIWDNNNLTELYSYKQVVGSHIGMFSMQPEEMPGTNSWLPDGTPVIIPAKDLWYPDLNATDPFGDIEGRIRSLLVGKPTPFFVLVYGQLVNNGVNATIIDVAVEMQRRLATGDGNLPPVITVGMQDMADLARQEGGYRLMRSD